MLAFLGLVPNHNVRKVGPQKNRTDGCRHFLRRRKIVEIENDDEDDSQGTQTKRQDDLEKKVTHDRFTGAPAGTHQLDGNFFRLARLE